MASIGSSYLAQPPSRCRKRVWPAPTRCLWLLDKEACRLVNNATHNVGCCGCSLQTMQTEENLIYFLQIRLLQTRDSSEKKTTKSKPRIKPTAQYVRIPPSGQVQMEPMGLWTTSPKWGPYPEPRQVPGVYPGRHRKRGRAMIKK